MMRLITIQQAIDHIDALKPNMFPVEKKVQWLSDVDSMVFSEIYATHVASPVAEFHGYADDVDTSLTLLVPEPYTDIYRNYLAMQMDLATAESTKYTQDMLLFNASYKVFSDFWRSSHRPVIKRKHIRF